MLIKTFKFSSRYEKWTNDNSVVWRFLNCITLITAGYSNEMLYLQIFQNSRILDIEWSVFFLPTLLLKLFQLKYDENGDINSTSIAGKTHKLQDTYLYKFWLTFITNFWSQEQYLLHRPVLKFRGVQHIQINSTNLVNTYKLMFVINLKIRVNVIEN